LLQHRIPNPKGFDPTQLNCANQGQVYYTTIISPDDNDYLTANYMASLTGAVLSDPKVKRGHYHYQPWQVVDAVLNKL